MRMFGTSGGASSWPPSQAWGDLLAELRSASILPQSTLLIDFYHRIFDADRVSQCPALSIRLLEGTSLNRTAIKTIQRDFP